MAENITNLAGTGCILISRYWAHDNFYMYHLKVLFPKCESDLNKVLFGKRKCYKII